MEFIETEAVLDNDQQSFSDGKEEGKITDGLDDFIDNSPQLDEGVSFYRKLNNPWFCKQNRNLHNAVFECDYIIYENEDKQPELHDPVSRDLVTFDKSFKFEKSGEKFKKTFKNFGDGKNELFDAVIYGVIFYKSDSQVTNQNRIAEVLGDDLYNELLVIKDNIKLHRALLGYYNRCLILNKAFSKHNFFIKFFERRDTFRFLIKDKNSR